MAPSNKTLKRNQTFSASLDKYPREDIINLHKWESK
jgi:hypothetical protein